MYFYKHVQVFVGLHVCTHIHIKAVKRTQFCRSFAFKKKKIPLKMSLDNLFRKKVFSGPLYLEGEIKKDFLHICS